MKIMVPKILTVAIVSTFVAGASADVINDGSLTLSGKGTTLDYVDQSFSTANGLVIEFDFATWKTDYMSDGFAVALFDANTASPTVGGEGGSLGYANRTGTPGLTDGVLGIGFDAHGNFSAEVDGKTGGNAGSTPSSVSLRGSASSSYAYIAGTGSLPNYMNNSSAGTEATALTRNVRITVGTNELVTVEWKIDGTENWETLIDHVDASAQIDLTDEVKVGITKSFNGNMNAQISNLSVAAIPEPAIISLCLIFGGGILTVRRIFSI
ncbi:hypothetical protein P4E94_10100 [Pontiellaceae bacterium B12219]|nr:hypothetical protein [Pontiellaceae bacterium B12219]